MPSARASFYAIILDMLDRDQIIEYLKNFAISKDYVFAMWLEGADGLNQVDEYSDIDFWFDVEKSHQESFLKECVEELSKLSKIDSRVDDIRTEIAQSNIHLENTSEYLTLDICVQSHEIRGVSGSTFYENDIAERPLVLFDKSNVIVYKNHRDLDLNEINSIFIANKNRILQESRVKKYINRKQYLEAYSKYIDNITNPLVTIVRLIYTPNHVDYELCHISNHLPKEVVVELEKLYQIKTLEDITNNLNYAKELLSTYEQQFQAKYNIITDKN